MTRKHFIILLLLLASCTREVSEFQKEQFVKYFGSGDESQGNAVLALADGGYLAVGYDTQGGLQRKQMLAVRTDRAGNTLWQQYYGDEHEDVAIALSTIGTDFLIAGNSTHPNTGESQILMVRVNSQGDTLSTLTRSFRQSLYLSDLAVTTDAIYMVGYCNSGSIGVPNYDHYILKLSHDGDSLKMGSRTTGFNETFNRIFLKDDGNLLVVGTRSGTQESNHIFVTEVTPFLSASGTHYNYTDGDQTFANAIYSNSILYILYNEGGKANLIALDDSFTALWEITSGIEHPGTSLCMSTDGYLHLCAQNGNQIVHYKVSPNGSIVSDGANKRPLPGVLSSMITTPDDGILMVGATAPDYGSMMQMIKTDKQLFLFEQ